MPKRRSNSVQRNKNTELIETAAEQLADLLWKHYILKNRPKCRRRKMKLGTFAK
jgi:dihydroneopterin aldolase